MNKHGVWIGLCGLMLLVGCADPAPQDPPRGVLPGVGGKADAPGSCRHDDTDYCGRKSPDGCWCDEQCQSYGDCCANDYAQVCGGGEPQAVPLAYKSYKVMFTNPQCHAYRYASPVPTADGQGERTGKPRNVYCTKSDDFDVSANRPESPQWQLLRWIEPLGQGDELFLAYLSYSNRDVGAALCAAAERGAQVTLVLDSKGDLARTLEGCGGHVLIRGHVGGIGYAHNKLMLVNPTQPGPADSDTDHMRMVFSSGNLSSGTTLHHENWHFIEVKRESYFARAHLCLMQAQLDSAATRGKSAYRDAINACRGAIPYPEETDIKAFFIPNRDDSQTLTDKMVAGVEQARRISIGVHRLGNTTLVSSLERRLRDDASVTVQMVADDDLYWLLPYGGAAGQQVGSNMAFEAYNVRDLWQAGDQQRFAIRYLETNHQQHLLHHNKFILFQQLASAAPDAVLCGAANLTNAGFWDNFENIYYIEIPEVVAAFQTQFARFWDGTPGAEGEPLPPIATPPERMPSQDIALP